MPQLEQLIRKATKVAADADGKARKVQARAAAGYLYAYQQAKQQHSSTAAAAAGTPVQHMAPTPMLIKTLYCCGSWCGAVEAGMGHSGCSLYHC